MAIDAALARKKADRVATNNSVFLDNGNYDVTIVGVHQQYVRWVHDKKRFPNDPKRMTLEWVKFSEKHLADHEQLFLAVQLDDSDIVLGLDMPIKIGANTKFSAFISATLGINGDAQYDVEPQNLVGFKGIAYIECKTFTYSKTTDFHKEGEEGAYSTIKSLLPREVRKPAPRSPQAPRPNGNGAGPIPANQFGRTTPLPTKLPQPQQRPQQNSGFVDPRGTRVAQPRPVAQEEVYYDTSEETDEVPF